MRLLTVGNRYPPWSIGGYEATWRAATLAWRAAGHQVRVLTTLPDPSDLPVDEAPDPEVKRELRWYWRAHTFPALSPRQVLRLERHNQRVLARQLVEFDPDAVVWWAMGGMSLSLLEAVRRREVPALGVVGDEWPVYGAQVDAWTRCWRGRGRELAVLVERATGIPARLQLDRAAHWAFVSNSVRDSAREAGWRVDRAAVVHPGVDASRFRSVAAPPWRWSLLYAGRIDPRKGIATAIQALAHLPQEASLTVHGHGDPGHLRELRRLVACLGLERRVHFEQDVDGVPGAMARCDALLFPVLWREPWGLVPLEAMATGRPVVASTAGGGVWEYLRGDENCLTFEPGDSAGLAAAVRRLAGSPELRRRVVEAGRATASRFTDHAYHSGLLRELELARPAGLGGPAH